MSFLTCLWCTSSTSKAFWSRWRIAASFSAFSFLSCCCIWLKRRRWSWHSSTNLSSSISINFWMAFHWFCNLIQWSNSSARRRFFRSRSSRSLEFKMFRFRTTLLKNSRFLLLSLSSQFSHEDLLQIQVIQLPLLHHLKLLGSPVLLGLFHQLLAILFLLPLLIQKLPNF